MKRLALIIALIATLISPLFAQQSATLTTAGNSVSATVAGSTVASFTIQGTFTGTLLFQVSPDATYWTTLTVSPVGSGTGGTSTTVPGVWLASVPALNSVRVTADTGFTGSALVDIRVSTVGSAPPPASSVAATVALGLREPDDASIASASTADTVISLTMAFDGTVWRRLTFGTAGTASAQVLSVQGVASMTPLQAIIASTQTVIPSVGAGATGAAVPANGVFIGAKDNSGNLLGDIACTQSKIYDASTTGNTELIAISGSLVPYICGYTIFAGGTVNVSLVAGTGTACASAASGTPSTGTSGASAALTPAYQLIAQTGIKEPIPAHGYLISAGSANAVCIKASGSVAVQAQIWYAQR